jgi:hypothetical protein
MSALLSLLASSMHTSENLLVALSVVNNSIARWIYCAVNDHFHTRSGSPWLLDPDIMKQEEHHVAALV